MKIGKLIKQTILLIGVLSISLAGISQNDQSGLKQEERVLEKFTSIEVGATFNVKLIQSEDYRVIIEANETHLRSVRTFIANEILTIEYAGLRKPSELFISIYVPELASIRLSGTAELINDGLFKDSLLKLNLEGAAKADLKLEITDLQTKASGATEVWLNGTTDKHYIKASGDAIIDADNFESKFTKVEALNNSFAKVNAIDEIEIGPYTEDRISYKNTPTTITKSRRTVVSTRSRGYSRYESRNRYERRQNRESDTKVNFGSLNVEVTDDPDSTVVIVGRHKFFVDDRGHARYSKIYRNRFNGHWGGVEIGINGYLTPEGDMNYPEEYEFLDLRLGKSIRFDLNLFEQNVSLSKNNKWGLITGVGLEFRNYRFDRKVELVSNQDQIRGYYIDGVGVKKSKLSATYLNIPLIFEFQTNAYGESNSFHIGVGMIMGLRVRSHTKIKFSEKNIDYNLIDPVTEEVFDTRTVNSIKEKEHDSFHLNPVKMDATLRVGWGWLNLYATYSLSTMFKSGEGPELYPFSVGITLLRW